MSLHVTNCRAGSLGSNPLPVEIAGSGVWSETLASGGTTATAAQPGTVLVCCPTVDGWVAFHPTNPDPSSSPRHFLFAGIERSFVVLGNHPGLKLEWLEV